MKERCNKKLPVFEKPLLQLEAKRKTCSFQSGLLEAERNGPSIHPGEPIPAAMDREAGYILDRSAFFQRVNTQRQTFTLTITYG